MVWAITWPDEKKVIGKFYDLEDGRMVYLLEEYKERDQILRLDHFPENIDKMKELIANCNFVVTEEMAKTMHEKIIVAHENGQEAIMPCWNV